MSAISARVAVVEGRNVIGIELPNQKRETVWLRELMASQDFAEAKAKLGLCLGKTIGGEPVIADLARMPHLLVAGTTGSISITGGEPTFSERTVNEYMVPLLRYARKRGIHSQINSNITLPYSRYEVLAPYLDVMHISFRRASRPPASR